MDLRKSSKMLKISTTLSLAGLVGLSLASAKISKANNSLVKPLGSSSVQAKARRRAKARHHKSSRRKSRHVKLHRSKGKETHVKGKREGVFTAFNGSSSLKDYNETLDFHKASNSKAVGGEHGRWTRVTMGRHQNGFKYSLQGVDGRINRAPSVYYSKIATLNYKNQAHAPKAVDLKVTPYRYELRSGINKKHTYKDAVIFDAKEARLFHPGETARILYQLQFFDSKTKKPLKLKNTAITNSDIDAGQSVGVYNPTKPHFITDKINVSGHSDDELHSGRAESTKYLQFGNKWFGKKKNGKVDKRDIAKHGSTDSWRPQGSLTSPIRELDNGKLQTQYQYDATGNGWQDEFHRDLAVGSGIPDSSARVSSLMGRQNTQHITKHANVRNLGNMFVVSSNQFAGPKLNLVGSKTAKADNPTDPKGWQSHLNLTNDFSPKAPEKTNFYYRLSANETYPKLMMRNNKEVVLSSLKFADKQIDPGLTVDKSFNPSLNGVKIYTQDVKDGKFKPISDSKVKKYLNIKVVQSTLSKKGSVSVTLKKPIDSKTGETKENSWLFNHTLNAVFHVKGNKNLEYEFTKSKGNNTWEADLYNASLLQLDDSSPTPKKAIVTITSRHAYPDVKVDDSHGAKFVYKMRNGKSDSSDDSNWAWDNYHGVVHPNQHLTYMLHFKIGAIKDSSHKISRYKELVINDNLDSHIAKIDHMYVSDKSLAGNKNGISVPAKFALHINRTGQFTKLLDEYSKSGKGGDLWIRYEATLNSSKPNGDNDKVFNHATLHPVLEGMQAGDYSGEKTETYTDSKGQEHENDYHTSGKAWRGMLSEARKYNPDANDNDYENDERNGYSLTMQKNAHWGNLTPVKEPDATTNKTVNPYVASIPTDGTKSYTNAKYSDYIIDNVNGDDSGKFICNFRLGTLNSTIGSIPKDVTFRDDIDSSFFEAKDVHIYDPDGHDVTSLGNKSITKVNLNGKNYYRVLWKIDGDNVKKIPFDGGSYRMEINVNPIQSRRVTETKFENEAYVYENIPGNPVSEHTNKVHLIQGTNEPAIVKTVNYVKDNRTGEVSHGDNDYALKANDPYTVHYHLVTDLGDTKDLSHFNIKDYLPEHSKLDMNSLQITVNKQDADGNWIDNTAASDKLNASATSAGDLVVSGGGNSWYNKQIVLDYAVKVYPEADWSNYYNHDARSGWGSAINVNGNDHITDGGQFAIPNKAIFSTADNTPYESIAAFDVKAQMFKTKQFIVQDNDAWTDNLDPSHYLPHLRNDRSAVTTAVRLQMPNYLKLNSVEAENEAKTAGFSRDEAHMLRADQDLVHNDKLLHNPDFGKAGYASSNHFIGEWKNGNGTTSHKGWANGLQPNTSTKTSGSDKGFDIDSNKSTTNGSPANLQDTSGKTFYLITKWAPKTKFYRDYAKLGNMRTGFSAQVKLDATSVGKRQRDTASPVLPPEHINQTYKANDVGIHLSNIYSYRDIIRDARFAQDGSTLDYRVFGKVKGLAVDKDNPTDFSKETNFGKAGNSPVETYVNKDASAVSQTGDNGTVKSVPIKPDKPIKQDESYDTFTRIDKLPANTYVGHKILQGYVSDSADTEVKGHSVMLTSDRTDSVSKNFDATKQNGQGMNDTVAKAQKLTNQTLANIRFDNNKSLEPLHKQVMNKANQQLTNPREYRLYLDYDNQYQGNDLQRIYREAYEAFMRKNTAAKAGYGLVENNKLVLFTTYDNHSASAQKADDNDHNVLLNDYKTKETSRDGLFDNTYAANANAEELDLTHMVIKMGHEKDMNGAMQTSIKGNQNVDYLIDTKIANMPLAKACEAWANEYQKFADKHDTQHAYMGEFLSRPRFLNPTTSDYKVSVINFQFNKRLLANGHQLYDQGKYSKDQIGSDGIKDQRAGDPFNAYSHENVNRPGTPTEGIDGSFRNYIISNAKLGNHQLDLDSVPFGVGSDITMRLLQNVTIYGAHYGTQGKGNNGSGNDGEVTPQPVISGKDAQNIYSAGESKADHDKAEQWLKDSGITQSITR